MTKSIAKIVNAEITSTFLGREDHGIFTAYLRLDYGGTEQTFGGYTLGTTKRAKDEDENNRNQSCKFGIKFLLQVLDILEVKDWEHLPGTKLRVDKEGWGDIYGIGHYLKDNWFYPADLAKEFFSKEKDK